MQFTPSNWQDINKYYCDSFVKLTELNDQLIYISKVNREGVYFSFSDQKEGVIWLHDDVPYDLDMVLPNKAMYQMGNHCYHMSRIPQRQYHRGITPNNCVVKKLTDSGWGNAPINFITLQGYVAKPMYRPLEDVIATPMAGSEALSPRFAYQTKSHKLWCDNKVIGFVNNKTKTIGCAPLLIPEISAFLGKTDAKNIYKVVST